MIETARKIRFWLLANAVAIFAYLMWTSTQWASAPEERGYAGSMIIWVVITMYIFAPIVVCVNALWFAMFLFNFARSRDWRPLVIFAGVAGAWWLTVRYSAGNI